MLLFTDRLLDEEAGKNFFGEIMKRWIDPELKTRAEEGHPQQEDIYQCLILLPNGQKPTVQFNKEAGFPVMARKAPGTSFQPMQVVLVTELAEVLWALHPKLNEKDVAFVYMKYMDNAWHIFFDFSPGHAGYVESESYRNWLMGQDIAAMFNQWLKIKVLQAYANNVADLKKIDLWAAPALMPYPLSKILDQLSKNDEKAAVQSLMSYCNKEFVKAVTSKWFDLEPFVRRKRALDEAIDSHLAGKFPSSIHVLIPQIEGITTDWLYSTNEPNIPWKEDSKAKRFQDIILSGDAGSFVWKQVAETTTSFVISGPVLATFKDWRQKVDPSFPNRHVVSHGKYDDEHYTEEASLRLILLLDSLYFLIRNHLK